MRNIVDDIITLFQCIFAFWAIFIGFGVGIMLTHMIWIAVKEIWKLYV